METIKKLLNRYKTELLYLIFGVATTLVNIVCYYLLNERLEISNGISTAVAWFVSVLFAFFTNRRWVFESKVSGFGAKLRECVSFFGSRVATGALDLLIMLIAVDLLKQPNLLWKVIANVLVILLNYIFGKLIFQKKNRS